MVISTNESTSVEDFYRGKSVFVTGATGFVGKVLVEKLLYSCKDIDKVYVLVRAKKNVTSEKRLQDMISTPLFERIRSERPKSLEKVVAVTGDILEKNFGISSMEEEQLFKDKISVVFHLAASVRFDMKMDDALNHNYESSKKMLSLCRRMNNLQSFVYMSTAFINAHKLHLEEVVYPPPSGLQELQAFVDDKAKLDKLLDGRPNTYTFTKALAENFVATNHGTIPTTIIRPSIVTSSAYEPFPGWLDGWSVVNALVASISLGYNRVIVGNGRVRFDLIPVDYVTNLAIVAAAKNTGKSDLKVFNSCSSSCNPITLKELGNNIIDFNKKNGYDDYRPYAVFSKDGVWKNQASFFLEKLPSLWRRVTGRKPKYGNVHSRVTTSRESAKYFTSRSYNMSADNTIALSRSLSRNDAKIFSFNPQYINWKEYINIYCKGIRKFLLK